MVSKSAIRHHPWTSLRKTAIKLGCAAIDMHVAPKQESHPYQDSQNNQPEHDTNHPFPRFFHIMISFSMFLGNQDDNGEVYDMLAGSNQHNTTILFSSNHEILKNIIDINSISTDYENKMK